MVTEEKLTARELDAAIAEKVMGLVPCDGWRRVNFGSAGGAALMKDCNHADNECYPTRSFSSMSGSYDGVPAYSRKVEVAKQVEDRIEDLGLELKYATALLEATGTQYQSSLPVIVWAIVRATPEERCVAALKAIEKGG